MKTTNRMQHRRSLIMVVAGLIVLASLPALSRAHAVSTSVTITNNSSLMIRNVYLSHVNADDWSGNQLGSSTIAAGASASLNDLACDAQQVKVIAEDENGCFLSTVINCGESSTWTITNDSARDCGGSGGNQP